MDLRRLEYFLAVVEHGQVTSAAAALHITQPTLSQAIRSLEDDLGVVLFHRDGRGLSPTLAGAALIAPAQRVLRDVELAQAAVDEVRDLSAGWLEIAAPDLLVREPMAAILADFARRHDRVPVRVRTPRDEDELVRLLMAGECELALTFLPTSQHGLVVHPIGELEALVVLPPGTPVGPGPIDLAALNGMGIVDTTRGFTPSRLVRAALREANVRLRPTVRNRHREAVIPLVLAGAGMAFTLPAYAAEAAAAGAEVRRLREPVTCAFGVIHRLGGLSPAARRFLHVAREFTPA